MSKPVIDSPFYVRWGLLVVILVFSMLGIEYLTSDLWFDELITLFDFSSKPRLRDIFLSYPVPNNHVLFSFILWLWLHVADFSVSEIMLRLPNYLIAIATLTVFFYNGKAMLGDSGAVLLVLTLAISPVYLAFFYQLRGYGLTVLLALIATVGSFHIGSDSIRKGMIYYIPSAFLLPCVIPTNIFLNISLYLFIVIVLLQKREVQRHVFLLVALGFSSLGGVIVYFPILSDLIKATRTTVAWTSPWSLCAHLLLAVGAHCGVFCIICLLMRYKIQGSTDNSFNPDPQRVRHILILLVCSIGTTLVAIFSLQPYPRSFVVYLAPLTLCAFSIFSKATKITRQRFYLLALVVIANGAFWFHFLESVKRRNLESGNVPQDLLQQYYARNSDISEVSTELSNLLTPRSTVSIFIDFHFFPALRYYWRLINRDILQIECLSGGKQFPLQRDPSAYLSIPQLIVAYNKTEAIRAYKETVGFAIELEKLDLPTSISVYRVKPSLQN